VTLALPGSAAHAKQLEKPSSSRRNRRSKVGRITGETGKSAKDERVAAGSVVAMKRSNVCGAKGPCHLQCLQHRGRQGRDDKGVH
jgi:hypothetical protein